MEQAKDHRVSIATALVALYVGAGGIAKLLGVPYVHSSFAKLGLPDWFGYFIGACEVLGSIGLLARAPDSYIGRCLWKPYVSSRKSVDIPPISSGICMVVTISARPAECH
jgi:DoxX-like protein